MKWYILGLLIVSFVFFIVGMQTPIMNIRMELGSWVLRDKNLYLRGTIDFFYDEKEYFIATLLVLFTFIFPILKYIFLVLSIFNFHSPKSKMIAEILDFINKWSMLDVFVVAIVIYNMKSHSDFFNSTLRLGTTYFAISVLLLMICSYMVKKQLKIN